LSALETVTLYGPFLWRREGMTSSSLELQGAIVAKLKADPGVFALVADRVFETVPLDEPFPFISYGPESATNDDADCIEAFSIFVQLDIWSRAVGRPEAKRIEDAVYAALHDQEAAMPLADNGLVFLEYRQSNYLRDPDGLTQHIAMSFEASIERAPTI
jgi:hypothetical protein